MSIEEGNLNLINKDYDILTLLGGEEHRNNLIHQVSSTITDWYKGLDHFKCNDEWIGGHQEKSLNETLHHDSDIIVTNMLQFDELLSGQRQHEDEVEQELITVALEEFDGILDSIISTNFSSLAGCKELTEHKLVNCDVEAVINK